METPWHVSSVDKRPNGKTGLLPTAAQKGSLQCHRHGASHSLDSSQISTTLNVLTPLMRLQIASSPVHPVQFVSLIAPTDDAKITYLGLNTKGCTGCDGRGAICSLTKWQHTRATALDWADSSASSYLPGLFKLGHYPGHHAQGGNEGQARQHLCDALTIHVPPWNLPVAAADAALQVGCDDGGCHGLADVKHGCPVGLGDGFVCLRMPLPTFPLGSLLPTFMITSIPTCCACM